MAAPVPPLQQPPGSNSCLPTAVRAVLQWHGIEVSGLEVSEWCGESAAGCWLDEALEGLRLGGFDVEELTGEPEDRLRAAVLDPVDPQPAIVTLLDPFAVSATDHAVVLRDVRSEDRGGVAVEIVEFMDPATGSIVADSTGRFWQHWDFAGRRAFILRP